jgi:hypothetical protein
MGDSLTVGLFVSVASNSYANTVASLIQSGKGFNLWEGQ